MRPIKAPVFWANSFSKWRAYARPVGVTLLLFLMSVAGPAASAGPVVPFSSCNTNAFSCIDYGNRPPYGGPVADSFGAAAQQFCEWFGAAHYPYPSNCPCDGTICSTVVSCEFQGILPSYEGSSQPKGRTTYTLRDSRNGNLWSSAGNTPDCFCPNNSGAVADGSGCACNSGYVRRSTTCVPPSTCPFDKVVLGMCSGPTTTSKTQGAPPPNQCTTNPCNIGTGRKYLGVAVYSSPTLKLNLTYNSVPHTALPVVPLPFGRNWSHDFGMYVWNAFEDNIGVLRPDGKMYEFTPPLSGNFFETDEDVPDRLEKLFDASSNHIGWNFYVAADNSVETFDTAGLLTAITQRNGQTTTLTYSTASTPSSIAPKAGLLIQVTDHFGRSINFAYDNQFRVIQMTDPNGEQYAFNYDEPSAVVVADQPPSQLMTSITFPGGQKRVYHYNEQQYTGGGNRPSVLTGVTDENGERYSVFKYLTSTLVTSTELAGGANKLEFVYNSDGSRVITDSLGSTRTYTFDTLFGVPKLTSINGAACPSCGPTTRTYDTNGFVASETDWNNNLTTYLRNDPYGRLDLETSRTEAAGTADARTITTDWHATYRLPALITEPGKSAAFTYDPNGNMLTRTVTDTATGASRTWSYAYNSIGQVLSMDGPRTDLLDLTTYSYDAVTGDLLSITNPLSQTTQITSYDANGRPLTIIDPNGLTTTLTYHPRGWLASRDVGGELTTFNYDNVGQLVKVTLPDGSFLTYTYDAAHRLTGISDNLNNSIAYTLDSMGNRTNEQVLDPAGALAQTRSRVFNSLNRLVQDIGGTNPAAQVTQYAYDAQGNLTSITDPLSRLTVNAYDALNRLVQITDPALGLTQYGYNAIDQLTSVTDPRSNTTSYNLDALDNLNSQVSPDTGTTSNTFDSAGNVLTSTDAKGQTTSYTYDALNRVTSVSYADGRVVNYGYDAGVNGIGRLTSIIETRADASLASQTLYTYDQQGRVLTDTRSFGNASFITQYSYDAAGRLATVVYPSGLQLDYAFDALGRVQRISATKAAVTSVLIDGVAYHPFGNVTGFVYGNGEAYARGYDLDGRVSAYSLANQSHAVGFDAASRIVSLSATANPGTVQSYGYDNLDRLTSAVNANNAHGYSYDILGNRTAYTVGTQTTTYQYPATSNQLESITEPGGAITAIVHDENGSIIDDGLDAFSYDARGRLVGALSAQRAYSYEYNALGQRITKDSPEGQALPGDINGDGLFTSADVVELNRIIKGVSPPVPAADCNEDGEVTRKDVPCVAKKLGKQTTQTDVEPTLTLTHYAYDLAGHLIGEFDDTGQLLREYVWLGDQPVAMLTGADTYYIHADHLNSPRVMTDANQIVVWRWDNEDPFGASIASEDPDGDGTTVTCNLRFPGQHFDSETGNHYNYFRDYDPGTGRYLTSEPLGIHGVIEQFGIDQFKAGDANLYLYTLANPFFYIDPDGERYRPGNNRELYESLNNLNDPRPYWRPPPRRKPPRCFCPSIPTPLEPRPGPTCQAADPFYGGDIPDGPRLCPCD